MGAFRAMRVRPDALRRASHPPSRRSTRRVSSCPPSPPPSAPSPPRAAPPSPARASRRAPRRCPPSPPPRRAHPRGPRRDPDPGGEAPGRESQGVQQGHLRWRRGCLRPRQRRQGGPQGGRLHRLLLLLLRRRALAADQLGFVRSAIQACPNQVDFVVVRDPKIAENIDVKRLPKRPAPPRFGKKLSAAQKERATLSASTAATCTPSPPLRGTGQGIRLPPVQRPALALRQVRRRDGQSHRRVQGSPSSPPPPPSSASAASRTTSPSSSKKIAPMGAGDGEVRAPRSEVSRRITTRLEQRPTRERASRGCNSSRAEAEEAKAKASLSRAPGSPT